MDGKACRQLLNLNSIHGRTGDMDTVVNWFGDLDEESQAVHNAKNRDKNAKENSKLHN